VRTYRTRICSVLIAIAIVLCHLSVFATDTNAEIPQYMQLFFDGTASVNVRGPWFSEPTTPTYVQKDGVNTLKVGGGGSRFAYIDINNDLFPSNKTTPSAITVRYFDEGHGYLTLRYENLLSTYTEPEKLVMEDTKTWKEYTFRLDDIIYRNGNGGADLVLAGWSNKYGGTPEAVYVQWIKAEKTLPQNSVLTTVSSKHAGNVFNESDEKILDVTLTNISEIPLTAGFKYQVLTYDKALIEENEIKDLQIAGEESVTTQLKVDVSKFGCYWLRITSYYKYNDSDALLKTNDYVDYDFSVVRKLAENEKPNSLMKVCTHYLYSRGVFEDNIELMSQIGITGIRDEVKWQDVEYELGKYHTPQNGTVKFKEAAAEGVSENMFLLGAGHTYYNNGDWSMPQNEAQVEAWKGYVEYVTKEFKGSIKYYELWNEPNLTNFNSDMVSATKYAELAKATYPIIKKNDPDAIFSVISTAQLPEDWIREACDAGILEYTDAVSVHPYDWSGEGSGVDRNFRNEFYVQRMKDFKKMMAEYGHPDIPIIISELGVTQITSLQSPTGQAAIATQMFAMTQGENLAEAFYYYDFQNDYMTAERYYDNTEANWGFIRNERDTVPAAAKPLYVAMANYNKLLSDITNVDSLVDGRTRAYRFKRNADGRQVIVLWNDNSSASVGMDLGVKSVEVLDMYGNSKGNVYSQDGKYSFEATFEPIYIIGDFEKMLQCEPQIKIDNGRIYAATNDYAVYNITDSEKRNLTVKAENGNYLEIAEIVNVAGGKGSVKVHTLKDAYKDNATEIYMYDRDKLVYYSKVHTCIVEPLTITTNVELHTENNPKRKVAAVTVKNTSNSSNITGTVRVDFSDDGTMVEERSFYDVKPGEQVTVRLNMPESIINRTVNANGSITLDYGYKKDMTFRLSKLDVKYSSKPPSLTGKVNYDEWSGSGWFAVEDGYAPGTYPSWAGKQDCSAMCTLKWDNENLYLLAEVSDDKIYNDYEPFYMWSGDGLQLAIAEVLDQNLNSNEFTELGIGPSKSGVLCWRYSSQTMYNEGNTGLSVGIVEKVEVTLEEQNGKWIYRSKIPWSEIFGENVKMKGGENLGFSLIVNDNDGTGRKGYLEYTSGIGNGKNTSLFGRIYLKK